MAQLTLEQFFSFWILFLVNGQKDCLGNPLNNRKKIIDDLSHWGLGLFVAQKYVIGTDAENWIVDECFLHENIFTMYC